MLPIRTQFNVISAKRMQRYSSAVFLGEIEIQAEAYAKKVVDQLKVYPPPIAGSRYRRTMRLQKGWDWTPTFSHDAFAIVFNNDATQKFAPHGYYARNVQDARFQLSIHQGRWSTIQGVMRRDRWRADIQKAFDKGAKKFNALH